MSPAQANAILSTPALVRRPARSPRICRRRRAEHRHVVLDGIPPEAFGILPGAPRRALDTPERALEIHDRGGRHVAALAQAGLQQRVGLLALGLGHGFEREAF